MSNEEMLDELIDMASERPGYASACLDVDELRIEILNCLEAGAQAQVECERLKAENAEYAQLVSVDTEQYLKQIEWLTAENTELRALVLEARGCAGHENAPHPADACSAWWDHFDEAATDICKCWYGLWAGCVDRVLEKYDG